MQRRYVFMGLMLAVLVGVFFYLLTEREREVFDELIHGYTITEIAEQLHLSVKTVDTHKKHIYEKLHCSRCSELVTLALRHGLLQ